MNYAFNIPVPLAARARSIAPLRDHGATTTGAPPPGVGSGAADVAPAMVPVFTTAQAAITFTAVPGLITAIWGLCGRLFPLWGKGDGVAVVLAMLFGLLIWWQSAPTEETGKAKALGIIYAFINSLSLAAVTLGIASFDK